MSMAIQFDTLRYVEKLKSAGVPESQAKAGAEALAEALGESASGTLARKDDVTSLKADVGDIKKDVGILRSDLVDVKKDVAGLKIEMADVKSDLRLLKWMVATIVAGVIALVAKSFF